MYTKQNSSGGKEEVNMQFDRPKHESDLDFEMDHDNEDLLLMDKNVDNGSLLNDGAVISSTVAVLKAWLRFKSAALEGDQLTTSEKKVQWYYAFENHQVGPLTEAELIEQLISGQFSMDGYIWRDGLDSWQAISDSGIQVLNDSAECEDTTKNSQGSQQEEEVWYYLDSNQQTIGPLVESELARLIQTRNLREDVLVWREGMADWVSAISAGITKI